MTILAKECRVKLNGESVYLHGRHVKEFLLSVLKAWVGLGQPGSARATYYCYARRI